MYFNIDKKFDLDISTIKDPIVLIGWPGIALVAKIAITSIKDSLKADLFLEIEYFDFPPKSTVEDGDLQIPTAEVYYLSREENDLFFLTANFQPQSAEGVFEFSKKFCEGMDKLTGGKIKMYVSCGALVSDKVNDEPCIHICGTDKDIIQTFLDQENTQLMDGGVIAGANGILVAYAGKHFAPGICMLAETIPLPYMATSPHASKAIVTLIKDYFKIDMNFDELDKKIDEFEKIFDTFQKQADRFMRPPDDDEEGPDSYFR